jgi:hypothetical protein
MASWQDQIREDSQRTQRSGDELQQFFRDKALGADDLSAGYRQQLDQYRQRLMEEGYSPEEIAGILQQEGYDSLLFDGGENNFLTGDEQNEIRGNPWAAKNAYNTQGLYDTMGAGIRNQRGAFDSDSGGADAALDRMGEGYDAAISDADLGPSAGFRQNMRGSLDRGRGDVMDPLNEARDTVEIKYDELGNEIGVSDRFTDAMTVGDEEMGAIRQSGANRLRAGQERMIQNARARAAQGNNANALAVGAFEQDARREGAQDQIAAAIDGEVAARGVRRGAEDNLEKTRLGQETTAAGFRGRGIDSAVGLSRDLSGAGGDLMRTELGAEEGMEDRRYRGETAGLDARLRTAESLGNARLNEAQTRRSGRAGMESEIANREYGNADRDLTRTMDLEERGEAEQNRRATGLMENNQRTRQYNQDTRYRQNVGLYDRNSQNRGKVADTRIGQYNRGGDVLGSQQDQQNKNAQSGYDRMGNQWQNTQGAANANTGIYAQAKSQPGFWSRLAGAAVGGASAAGGLGWKPFASKGAGS